MSSGGGGPSFANAGFGNRFEGELSPEDLFNMFFGGGGGGGFGPGFATSFGGGPSACHVFECYVFTDLVQLFSLLVETGRSAQLPSTLAANLDAHRDKARPLSNDRYSSSSYPFSSYLASHSSQRYPIYLQHLRLLIRYSHSTQRRHSTLRWRPAN